MMNQIWQTTNNEVDIAQEALSLGDREDLRPLTDMEFNQVKDLVQKAKGALDENSLETASQAYDEMSDFLQELLSNSVDISAPSDCNVISAKEWITYVAEHLEGGHDRETVDELYNQWLGQ